MGTLPNDVRGMICEIISDMLDNPDGDGIYPTTECYDRLEKMFNDAIGENDMVVDQDDWTIQTERLELVDKALRLAVGELSTHYPHAGKEPQELYLEIIERAEDA